MIKCPNCGGGMRFDPATQKLICDYCNTTQEIAGAQPVQAAGGAQPAYEQGAEATTGDGGGNMIETKLYTCPNCGGTLLSDADTAVTFCSYCGASVTLEGQLVKMQAPSQIIPFQKTKEEAQYEYRMQMSAALFVPNYMKQDEKLEQVRGIYMPYWLYDFDQHGIVEMPGQKSRRSGNYIIYENYLLKAQLDVHYESAAFDAASNYLDELSFAITPYDMSAAKAFCKEYISGFYADTADVEPRVYESVAKDEVRKNITTAMYKHPKYLRYGGAVTEEKLTRGLETTQKKMAYFPVWFLANEHQGRVSYAIMNGQTGKIAADLPIDYGKYLLSSVLFAIPLMLLFNALPLVLTPGRLAFIAVIFAIVSLIIANGEVNLLYRRERMLDDRGLQSVLKKVREKQTQEKLRRLEKLEEELRQEDYEKAVKKAAKQEAEKAAAKKSPWNARLQKLKNTVIKILIGVGLYTGMVAFSYLAYGVTKDSTMAGASCIFYIGMVIAIWFYHTFIREEKTPEEKAAARISKEEQKGLPKKFWIRIKPVAAILLAALVWLFDPIRDEVYYGAILAVILLVVFSFADVVRLHNKLTMRVPKQFGERGGSRGIVSVAGEAAPKVLLLAGLLGMLFAKDVQAAWNFPNYTNPETGYQACVVDTADYLTGDEEWLLLEQMKELTAHCNVCYYTEEGNTYESESYSAQVSETMLLTLYGETPSVIYTVDNAYDYIYAQDGADEVITEGKAYIITDNVYLYSVDGEFYLGACEAFSQIAQIYAGEKIAQPMRYICNAFLALLITLLVNYWIISRRSTLKKVSTGEILAGAAGGVQIADITAEVTGSKRVYSPASSGSSGGGGSHHSSSYHSSSHHSSSHHSSSHHGGGGGHRH